MAGPDNPEVALVGGGDGGDPAAFGDGHDAGVDQAEPEVGVRLNELDRSGPVIIGEVEAE